MDRVRFESPPRWWGPRLGPRWVRLLRPLRNRMRRRQQRLLQIDVRGLDPLKQAIADGAGALITPNHSGHADAYIAYEAADRLGVPFYFMVAWQVLGLVHPLRRWLLRRHGCFSVDREGTDMQAFKQAVEILQTRPNPLVIFPEGEVYHLNERVTPFREGPASIALTAARRAQRPIICVPAGIRYFYMDDPTPELLDLMDRLERAIFWRPQTTLPLERRIYRFAEGMLALKELEYLGRTSSGPIPERVADLSHAILGRLEDCYRVEREDGTVPERVKRLRHLAIERLGGTAADQSAETPLVPPLSKGGQGGVAAAAADGVRPLCGSPASQLHDRASAKGSDPLGNPREHLDDLYLVVQLFSYPGDYVAEQPTIERMAETLDKFEEDVLGMRTATIHGTRRAAISFGEPIPVTAERGRRGAVEELTALLESRVQALLDATPRPAG
ncbi:MAG: 1-acyl-sn-glycerol-3-phosphate acyltransferase [Planctomycetes bacterium]|nr:1-acyl-sn-glycerol-3-phosphate acyltransferase [Planctomycetota bacterium]